MEQERGDGQLTETGQAHDQEQVTQYRSCDRNQNSD